MTSADKENLAKEMKEKKLPLYLILSVSLSHSRLSVGRPLRASGKVTKVVVDAEIFPAHDLLV